VETGLIFALLRRFPRQLNLLNSGLSQSDLELPEFSLLSCVTALHLSINPTRIYIWVTTPLHFSKKHLEIKQIADPRWCSRVIVVSLCPASFSEVPALVCMMIMHSVDLMSQQSPRVCVQVHMRSRMSI
jgi:hypothetical protein